MGEDGNLNQQSRINKTGKPLVSGYEESTGICLSEVSLKRKGCPTKRKKGSGQLPKNPRKSGKWPGLGCTKNSILPFHIGLLEKKKGGGQGGTKNLERRGIRREIWGPPHMKLRDIQTKQAAPSQIHGKARLNEGKSGKNSWVRRTRKRHRHTTTKKVPPGVYITKLLTKSVGGP